MSADNLIEIKIVKIISAPKWKIIRLLTKPWNFPEYISFVKEVSVIQKTRDLIKTSWRVTVEKITINWVEEDTLALKQNMIYFKALEGDLAEFKGEWIINECPEGVEVNVHIHLKVGIPGIGEFADAQIKKLFTKTFEAIIDALESRLITQKYAGYKSGDNDKIAGFGLIGHPYNYNHMVRYLQSFDPNFKAPSRDFLGQIFMATPSFKLCDIRDFKSKTGAVAQGCLIVVTFIPDMLEKDPWIIFSKVVKACKMAEKYGVAIAGLGGFSSLVGERIGHGITDEVEVAVTTGNTFTAALALDGVFKAAEQLDVDITLAKVCIIGSWNAVGNACARALVDKVKQLTITERREKARGLFTELEKRRKARVEITNDNNSAVKGADIVITTANVSASFLKSEWFKPGAIICDVGYPKNISYTNLERNDILIFSGGLAKSPTPFSFPVDIGLPANDVMYGCFAEAIILSLEKRFTNFSFGREDIPLAKIDEIRDLGRKHGFEVSDFYWGNKLVTESLLQKVKEVIKDNKER